MSSSRATDRKRPRAIEPDFPCSAAPTETETETERETETRAVVKRRTTPTETAAPPTPLRTPEPAPDVEPDLVTGQVTSLDAPPVSASEPDVYTFEMYTCEVSLEDKKRGTASLGKSTFFLHKDLDKFAELLWKSEMALSEDPADAEAYTKEAVASTVRLLHTALIEFADRGVPKAGGGAAGAGGEEEKTAEESHSLVSCVVIEEGSCQVFNKRGGILFDRERDMDDVALALRVVLEDEDSLYWQLPDTLLTDLKNMCVYANSNKHEVLEKPQRTVCASDSQLSIIINMSK